MRNLTKKVADQARVNSVVLGKGCKFEVLARCLVDGFDGSCKVLESASMRTRTFPSIFTSLAFWINSQTQRRGVVGDASTPARSFAISSWIFVAMLRLCALSCEAENCDLNDTKDRTLSPEWVKDIRDQLS